MIFVEPDPGRARPTFEHVFQKTGGKAEVVFTDYNWHDLGITTDKVFNFPIQDRNNLSLAQGIELRNQRG
ncbi:hypothetical protein HY407_00350 [Candidatus Gottesmanbacteria bacterium]|nr:hypothetical protein [Candidatus Roizmanbacteria bacterium]MBI4066810.1 hypothetical protein [Candidatus Gottesmanbacteria bacterium]